MQFLTVCNAIVKMSLKRLSDMVIMTLLPSLLHETLHESWLENLTIPHCPNKLKSMIPGVSLPSGRSSAPCRTVIPDPRLEHQVDHGLVGDVPLPNCSSSKREDR